MYEVVSKHRMETSPSPSGLSFCVEVKYRSAEGWDGCGETKKHYVMGQLHLHMFPHIQVRLVRETTLRYNEVQLAEEINTERTQLSLTIYCCLICARAQHNIHS